MKIFTTKIVVFTMFYLFGMIFNIASGYTINSKRIVKGEELNYRAKWGILNIGMATTKTDKRLYKIGSSICYKVDLKAQTNGLAKLFYLNDRWISYLEINSFDTYKSLRSIHEGKYRLEEIVDFDHKNNKAYLRKYDDILNSYVLRNTYETTNMRDVIAGFISVRNIDYSNLKKGETLTIDGFYKETGYKIQIIYLGKEIVKTNNGKISCYRIKPLVPKNKVFDGLDAVDVWLSADRTQKIIYAKAKLMLGVLELELIQ